MKKTEKIRYEIDPHNRLIYEKTGEESEVPWFRTVLDGEFEIDENNCVTYHVKKSQGSDVPQQVKLRGKWSLDKEHNLVLTLDKWGNQIAGNKLTVESELIDAKDNKLSFAVTSKDSENNTHIYIVKLGGRWQADEYNRLTFNIEKEAGVTERITMRGAWEVNQQNEFMYTYEKSVSGKKEKITKTITLKGYWEIAGKHRIIYVLNKEIGSEFDFKVSVGKPAARGLEYEIGVGVAPSKKTITLFGEWKVSKKIGLLFEMPYEEGKIRSVILGGWGKLDKNFGLELRVQNKIGEDLGIDVKLSRSLLEGQGEAFIRALRSQKEVSIVAGVGFRW
ncbi:MAG: hypothetical protein HY761_11400 [Candidatus Omnitrophica bacterium]|nr:hypothetical protein [Candidatus Omnitrophota bacterium]